MPKKIELKIDAPSIPTPPERIMPPLDTPKGFFRRHKAVATALVIFIIGAAAAGSYYYQSGQWDKDLTNTPVLQHKEKDTAVGSEMKTYTNDKYNFTFQYPSYLDPVLVRPTATLKNSKSVFSAALDKTPYVGTNFVEASVQVNVAENSSVSKCAEYVTGVDKTEIMTRDEIINGTQYLTITLTGAAAGNSYITNLDRVLQGTNCIEYAFLLQTGNIGNYDPALGIKPVDENAVLAKLKTILDTAKYATDNSQTTPSPTAGNKTYIGKNFVLTLQYPNGYDLKEGTNYILISPTPYKVDELGMDNAFFKLTKYDASHTKDAEIAAYKKNLKNAVESQVTIDGLTFKVHTGDDWGRFSGDTAGRVKVVFFNKSWLEIIEMPQGNQQTYDPIAVGTQILNTFKFSN